MRGVGCLWRHPLWAEDVVRCTGGHIVDGPLGLVITRFIGVAGGCCSAGLFGAKEQSFEISMPFDLFNFPARHRIDC